MEVHRQRCQACQSVDLRNILVRSPGSRELIFVACGSCGELVARYELSGYYHHGKGVESYVRFLGAPGAESARRVLDEFEHVKREAVSQFERVLDALRDAGKEL